MKIHVSAAISAALRDNKPVVALETAVVTHGLPFPDNLTVAREMESAVGNSGALPATIGLIGGEIKVGITDDELQQLARPGKRRKVSLRDLAAATLAAEDGGTTVAATAHIAHLAGIQVFVTGGIGGAHRGQPFDISADLPVLATTPLVVVCSGAKSILDLPLTLEWLETHAVPTVGYQTNRFPAFFYADSGLPVDYRADSSGQVAAFAQRHWALGLRSAVLVGVPVPDEESLERSSIERAIAEALDEAAREGIHGKATTPFLLQRVAALTGGESLRANRALLIHNSEVGAEIALALAHPQTEVEHE